MQQVTLPAKKNGHLVCKRERTGTTTYLEYKGIMYCYHKLHFSEGEDHALCQQYTLKVTLYNIIGMIGFSLH
jgi:hypothetical protein